VHGGVAVMVAMPVVAASCVVLVAQLVRWLFKVEEWSGWKKGL